MTVNPTGRKWNGWPPVGDGPAAPLHLTVVPALDVADIRLEVSGSYTGPADLDALGADQDTLRSAMYRWLSANGFGVYNEPFDPVFTDGTGGFSDGNIETAGPAGSGQGSSPSLVQTKAQAPIARVTPLSARVVGLTEQPYIVDHAVWHNPSTTPATYEAVVDNDVEESVSSEWSKSQSIATGAEVGVSVGPTEAKATIQYSNEWGESHSQSESVAVGTENKVSQEVPPHAYRLAALVAQRGFLEVEVTWQSELIGGYLRGHFYSGHSHKGAPVKGWFDGLPKTEVLAAWVATPVVESLATVGIHHTLITTQRLKIGFYADADLSVYDLQSDTPEGIDAAIGGTKTTVIVPPTPPKEPTHEHSS